ncbi:amidohydrolase family protein [Streptosporangium sp. NPDC003464]
MELRSTGKRPAWRRPGRSPAQLRTRFDGWARCPLTLDSAVPPAVPVLARRAGPARGRRDHGGPRGQRPARGDRRLAADRFQAFAAIPTQSPAAAAAELERAVGELGFPGAMLYGRTGDKLADHPDNDELYATAERLGVPLHFHPQTPVQPVIDAYYSDIGPIGTPLAGAAIGWYYDLGVQYLRMIFSGVFDRFPDLQVIAGHWGEVVMFYLDHTGFFAEAGGLQRPLADYFKQNFWVAGSGTNSPRYLRWTAEVMGTDRMLYSTDYPFTYGFRPGGFPYVDTSNGAARSFLEDAPFTDEQKADIAHRNWERLTARAAERPAA